jgi:hypothetical protein
MPHNFTIKANQRNEGAWLDDHKAQSDWLQISHFYRQTAERKYMKTIWGCFVAIAFLSSLILSGVAANNNDFDKATYFLLLAILNLKGLK